MTQRIGSHGCSLLGNSCSPIQTLSPLYRTNLDIVIRAGPAREDGEARGRRSTSCWLRPPRFILPQVTPYGGRMTVGSVADADADPPPFTVTRSRPPSRPSRGNRCALSSIRRVKYAKSLKLSKDTLVKSF